MIPNKAVHRCLYGLFVEFLNEEGMGVEGGPIMLFVGRVVFRSRHHDLREQGRGADLNEKAVLLLTSFGTDMRPDDATETGLILRQKRLHKEIGQIILGHGSIR